MSPLYKGRLPRSRPLETLVSEPDAKLRQHRGLREWHLGGSGRLWVSRNVHRWSDLEVTGLFGT